MSFCAPNIDKHGPKITQGNKHDAAAANTPRGAQIQMGAVLILLLRGPRPHLNENCFIIHPGAHS